MYSNMETIVKSMYSVVNFYLMTVTMMKQPSDINDISAMDNNN